MVEKDPENDNLPNAPAESIKVLRSLKAFLKNLVERFRVPVTTVDSFSKNKEDHKFKIKSDSTNNSNDKNTNNILNTDVFSEIKTIPPPASVVLANKSATNADKSKENNIAKDLPITPAYKEKKGVENTKRLISDIRDILVSPKTSKKK